MKSDMGNSSGTQPEGNPYRLTKGPNGWSGSTESFGVNYNVIKIKYSDGNPNNVPSEEQCQYTVDEEGNFSQHILIGPGHESDLHRLWMDKIGPYLGHWVLGKGFHVSPPWRLMKFPEGYTLWLHKTGSITDPANPRTDAYLHGAPHLGPQNSRSQNYPTIFRSPMEFVPHAIWLMKGGEGRCLCKYCQPGQSQNDINDRLDHIDHERAPDDDGDGGDGSHSRRGRGGGSGSQARRARRAKRERSPAVMAKDYRVGNKRSGTV